MSMLKETIPEWFRDTPLFDDLVAKQRATDDAARSALARERIALRASEAKAAPQRQKALDAADARLRAAQAVYDAARAAHTDETCLLRASGHAPSARLNLIERELVRLAHPAIGTALSDIAQRIESARRVDQPNTASLIMALHRARREVADLYTVVDVDAVAQVARVMAELSVSPTTHAA